jgi:hypothetical protein
MFRQNPNPAIPTPPPSSSGSLPLFLQDTVTTTTPYININHMLMEEEVGNFVVSSLRSSSCGSFSSNMLSSESSSESDSDISSPSSDEENVESKKIFISTKHHRPHHLRHRNHSDDAKDRVFLGIIQVFQMNGNKPSSSREISDFILDNGLLMLGGKTPNATVSSRISQHFKRCKEKNLPPIIGKLMINNNPRKFKYYLVESDQDPMEGYESANFEKGQEEDGEIDFLDFNDF